MPISLNRVKSILIDNDIKYKIEGDNILVNNLSAIDKGVERSLCYYVGDNYNDLSGIENSIIICNNNMKIPASIKNTIIYTDNPQLSFYLASKLFEDKPKWGIDKNSLVDPSTRFGKKVSIGPYCHIENCIIGDEVTIESGVKIYKDSIIGDRVHIQSNTVIGATGVMWTWNDKNEKISCTQTGNVIIENDVFIGSNITIVKGAFKNRSTIIGKGTMIAHGTMIGHGAIIGLYNHFANNVSIAGSVITGNNCFFGSGATIRPHIKLARDMIIGAGAVVVSNFDEEPGIILAGNPAKILRKKKRKYAGVPAKINC